MTVGFLLVKRSLAARRRSGPESPNCPLARGLGYALAHSIFFVKLEDEEDELTRCIVQDIRQQLDGIRDTTTLIGAEI